MTKTKLYEMRIQKKIRQEEMANLVGIKQPTYSRKERGVTDFTMDEWILMANILEVEVDEIYKPNLRKGITSGKAANKSADVPIHILNELDRLKNENSKLREELKKLKEKTAENRL